MGKTRNVFPYFGGKGNMADMIVSLLPEHRIYSEAFSGGANVLIRKAPSVREVLNDLNGEVINFFLQLRDNPRRLIRAINLTPFSRKENIASWNYDGEDPVEMARLFYVRSCQSFGGGGLNHQSGWRFGVHSRSSAITQWNKTSHLWEVARRLKNVQIECDDALKVAKRCDSPDTVHYWDPPYAHESRPKGDNFRGYMHEMTDGQHVAMAQLAYSLKGKVIISGYRCDLYDELFGTWRRIDVNAKAVNNAKRVESLWLSPNCNVPVRRALL